VKRNTVQHNCTAGSMPEQLKVSMKMTNISKEFRTVLSQISYVSNLQLVAQSVSTDSTIKYLFKLNDDLAIESVLIPSTKNRLKKRSDSHSVFPHKLAARLTASSAQPVQWVLHVILQRERLSIK